MRGQNSESPHIICIKTMAWREREKRDAGEIYILTSHSGLSQRENSNNLEHGDKPNRFSYKLRRQKADDEYLMRLAHFSHFFPSYLFSLPWCVFDTLHG